MNLKINNLVGEASHAGNVSVRALQQAASASPAFVNQQPNLEGFHLRDVVNDTRSRAYCGPTTVAAITGMPISLVRDAYRLVRHGAGWVTRPRAPRITGTYWHETEQVLRLLGFTGSWQIFDSAPTFAAFMEKRVGKTRTHPCAVFVTRHVVAVSGWQFCDTFSKGIVVEADDAPRRRARVKKVFVITGRLPASIIPRKDYSAVRIPTGRPIIDRVAA